MSKQDIAVCSETAIPKALELVDFRKIQSIHCYRTLEHLHELPTESIREYVALHYPHITISEPYQNAAECFDIIFVPILGFDKFGHRLGYGKGYYDRFLSKQARAVKIGLAYDWSEVHPYLLHESHDVPLDYIVTDKRVLSFI